ncbi:MAG: transposase [Cryobacterium sp.]|nr:transposase [Oligoflexia bacterium]
MQFQVNAAGKRIFPSEFKQKILEELRAGATASQLGRQYGIATQNVIQWKKLEQSAVLGKSHEPKAEETVPLAEYKKALEEIKNLRRSLVSATLDRDILKEAHDIAVKKKWISPAK